MSNHNRFTVYTRECKRCHKQFKSKTRIGRVCDYCNMKCNTLSKLIDDVTNEIKRLREKRAEVGVLLEFSDNNNWILNLYIYKSGHTSYYSTHPHVVFKAALNRLKRIK